MSDATPCRVPCQPWSDAPEFDALNAELYRSYEEYKLHTESCPACHLRSCEVVPGVFLDVLCSEGIALWVVHDKVLEARFKLFAKLYPNSRIVRGKKVTP